MWHLQKRPTSPQKSPISYISAKDPYTSTKESNKSATKPYSWLFDEDKHHYYIHILFRAHMHTYDHAQTRPLTHKHKIYLHSSIHTFKFLMQHTAKHCNGRSRTKVLIIHHRALHSIILQKSHIYQPKSPVHPQNSPSYSSLMEILSPITNTYCLAHTRTLRTRTSACTHTQDTQNRFATHTK